MKGSDTLPPLWTCPKCRAKFVTANMSHSGGRFRVDDLFANSDPHVFQKTRLVFMVRMRFAGVYPRKSYLRAAFLLTRRLPPDPRIAKVTSHTPRCIGYELRIDRLDQLDATVQQWLNESYAVGAQKDFVRRGNAARRRSPLNRA